MAWLTREKSEYDARPQLLYRFVLGTRRWLYAGGTKDVVLNSETYTASPITHGGVGIGAENDRDNVGVSIPRTSELAALFYAGAPEGIVFLTIYEKHDGDTDYVVRWQGRLVGFALEGNVTVKLTGETYGSSARQPGVFAYFQVLCRHLLGDARCRVQLEEHKQASVVSAITGSTVTVSSMGSRADGWADGGQIVGSGGTRRMVLDQAGPVLLLSSPPRDLSVGEAVTVYAGCDLTLATCRTKFGNYLNYGGFPWIPHVNLFSGASLVAL